MKAICIFLLFLLPQLSGAQNKIISGNGKIISKQKVLPSFNELYVDLYCDVFVQLGSMPMVEIIADKNVQGKLALDVRGDELKIRIKEGFWLKSTRPKIYIQLPYLTKLTTRGLQTNIGKINIEGIDVDEFETDLIYGTVSLEGKVKKLLIHSSNLSYYTHQGILDANHLIAQEVDAKIIGSNSANVSVSQKLTVHLDHDAVMEYSGAPPVINLEGRAIQEVPGVIHVQNDYEPLVEAVQTKKSPAVKLKYVEVKIKNNSLARRHFIIKGPNKSGNTFSYGFPMMPLARRTKNVPVGTQIFLDKKGLKSKELVTITAADNGKVLDLFSK